VGVIGHRWVSFIRLAASFRSATGVFWVSRYLAIGTGDTELYIVAEMLTAVVISVRVFLFRGAGKANCESG